MRSSVGIDLPLLLFLAVLLGSCSSVPVYRLEGAVDASADTSVRADGGPCAQKAPGEHFRFFVSTGTHAGDLQGASGPVAQVDSLCQGAGQTKWPGTRWRAYYWYDANTHPSERLIDACDGWFAVPSGAPAYRLFANKAALRNEPEGLPNVTQDGLRVEPGDSYVWTGGSATESRNRCNGWHETVNGTVGTAGDATNVERWMLDNDTLGCAANGHLYCIEQP